MINFFLQLRLYRYTFVMHTTNIKLILLIALISISNISYAEKAPFESSYEPLPYTNTIFRNANIYDGEGNEFSETDLINQRWQNYSNGS